METQRCLYEVLGVQSTASNEEIRSAYRKLALKWHPDKIQQSGASPEVCQEATLHFQEIGRAYEVLADPSERSWYDSHRSQILSSSSSSAPSDFDFNPWPYFSASVFAGYGDTGKGFYAVYGDLFTQLHQQEVSFARAYGLRVPEYPPDMGNLSTVYSQVQTFYNHWLGFSTVKDFAWCDEYKASMGPNRKLRRLMEEENKKIRSKARKEFNEAIRRLAAFVKKRDKRVLERQIEVQRLEKEKEEMRKARRKKEEEEKIMKARQYKEAEWTKIKSEHDVDDGSDIDESIGSYAWGQSNSKSSGGKKERQDEFFCIVCNKKFRSDEQWRNHERSKKHLEKVAILKESFEEEDKDSEAVSHGRVQDGIVDFKREASAEWVLELEESPDIESNSNIPGKGKVETSSPNASAGRYPAEKPRTEGNAGEGFASSIEGESDGAESEEQVVEDDEFESLLTMVNSYASRQQQSASEDSDDVAESSALGQVHSKEGDEDKDEIEEEEMLAVMLKSHQIRKDYESSEDREDPLVNKATSAVEGDKLNEDIGALSKKKKSKSRLRSEKQQEASLNRHAKIVEELIHDKEVGRQKCDTMDVDEKDFCDVMMQESQEESVMLEKDAINISKAEKVEKRHSRESLSTKGRSMNGHSMTDLEPPRRPPRGKKGKGNCKKAVLTCETCGEDFDSRNQLFKHISATKHAVLLGK